MNHKYGTYSCPRKCDKCEFTTIDREAYWKHVLAHDTPASTRIEGR